MLDERWILDDGTRPPMAASIIPQAEFIAVFVEKRGKLAPSQVGELVFERYASFF